MQLEGSPPPKAPRRRERWRWSCLPLSCFRPPSTAGPNLAKESAARRKGAARASWLPRFPLLLSKLRRSLSSRSAVAPELEKQQKRRPNDCGGEIPAIVVAAVRPALLFAKRAGGKRKREATKERASANVFPSLPLTIALSPASPEIAGKEGGAAAGSTPKPPCDVSACWSVGKGETLVWFLTASSVMLLMLAVGGRMFATFFTSSFFYLASYLNGPDADGDGSGGGGGGGGGGG